MKMMDVTTFSSDEDSAKTGKNGSSGGTSSSGDRSDGNTSGADNNNCSGSRSSPSSSSGEELDDIVKSLQQRNHNTERYQITTEEDGEMSSVTTLSERNQIAIAMEDDEDEHSGSEQSPVIDIGRNQMSTNDSSSLSFDHAGGLESLRNNIIDQTNYDDANDAFSDKRMEIQSEYHGNNERFGETKDQSSEDSEGNIFSDDDDDDDDYEGEKQQEKDKMAKEEILRKICKSIQTMYTLYEMEPSSNQKDKSSLSSQTEDEDTTDDEELDIDTNDHFKEMTVSEVMQEITGIETMKHMKFQQRIRVYEGAMMRLLSFV